MTPPLHTLDRSQMIGLAVPVVIAAVLAGLVLFHLTGFIVFAVEGET